MTEEQWLPAREFEHDYEISDLGRVRRSRPSGGWPTGHIRRPTAGPKGYCRIDLVDTEGRRCTRYVHRLVLSTFVGPCPPGYVANHKNGDKGDNRLANLEWVTPEQNIAHALRTGLMGRGESHHESKLTADDVREIRQLYATGKYTQAFLAAQFGVTDVLISRVVRGKNWAHIDGAIPDQVEQIAREHAKVAHPRGERAGLAKLTADQVCEMRDLYLTGKWSSAQLAARYGISDVSILAALRGRTWSHIPADLERIEQIIRQHREHPDRQGAKNGRAKLTENDVREIRRLYEAGEYDQRTLAARFRVSKSNIGMIIQRKTWKHVT